MRFPKIKWCVDQPVEKKPYCTIVAELCLGDNDRCYRYNRCISTEEMISLSYGSSVLLWIVEDMQKHMLDAMRRNK